MYVNWVYSLVGVPGTTVIYTYDEDPTDPNNPEPPIGIAWDSPRGKRILLGYPLIYTNYTEVRALIAKAVEYFGESTTGATNGDLDGSGIVDISDLTMMIDFLYISFTPPLSMNGADVDYSCNVDISDVTYLIGYLFMGGPAPLAGCLP